jgi:hypothetical protein
VASSVGVFFKDATKIVTDPQGHIVKYIERVPV